MNKLYNYNSKYNSYNYPEKHNKEDDLGNQDVKYYRHKVQEKPMSKNRSKNYYQDINYSNQFESNYYRNQYSTKHGNNHNNYNNKRNKNYKKYYRHSNQCKPYSVEQESNNINLQKAKLNENKKYIINPNQSIQEYIETAPLEDLNENNPHYNIKVNRYIIQHDNEKEESIKLKYQKLYYEQKIADIINERYSRKTSSNETKLYLGEHISVGANSNKVIKHEYQYILSKQYTEYLGDNSTENSINLGKTKSRNVRKRINKKKHKFPVNLKGKNVTSDAKSSGSQKSATKHSTAHIPKLSDLKDTVVKLLTSSSCQEELSKENYVDIITKLVATASKSNKQYDLLKNYIMELENRGVDIEEDILEEIADNEDSDVYYNSASSDTSEFSMKSQSSDDYWMYFKVDKDDHIPYYFPDYKICGGHEYSKGKYLRFKVNGDEDYKVHVDVYDKQYEGKYGTKWSMTNEYLDIFNLWQTK